MKEVVSQNAIVISGKIGSGKSTQAKMLADRFLWSIISFSRYVKFQAEQADLVPVRENLQSLGNEIFAQKGPAEFLEEVVEFCEPIGSVHIYESVRHISIQNAIRDRYKKTLTIYLEATDNERYKRYLNRLPQGELAAALTLDQFLLLSHHQVERGIEDLFSKADVKVPSEDPNSVHQRIVAHLKQNGLCH